MAGSTLNVFLAVFLLSTTLDLYLAIEVIDVTFSNVTQHNFTVHWGYQLNGFNVSRLEGFDLTVSSVYDVELVSEELSPTTTLYSPGEVDGGTTFYVCIAPVITNDKGNLTCGFVTTFFDPWDLRGQLACYIGITIFLVFVVLVAYDFKHPRVPPQDTQEPDQSALKDRPVDLTQSNIELTDNMF